jgi:hypothetical protein
MTINKRQGRQEGIRRRSSILGSRGSALRPRGQQSIQIARTYHCPLRRQRVRAARPKQHPITRHVLDEHGIPVLQIILYEQRLYLTGSQTMAIIRFADRVEQRQLQFMGDTL